MLESLQRFANNIWRSQAMLIVVRLFISMIMVGIAMGILVIKPFLQSIISSEKISGWIENNCFSSVSCIPQYVGLSCDLLLSTGHLFA